MISMQKGHASGGLQIQATGAGMAVTSEEGISSGGLALSSSKTGGRELQPCRGGGEHQQRVPA